MSSKDNPRCLLIHYVRIPISAMFAKRYTLALASALLLAFVQIVKADGDVACGDQPPILPHNTDFLARCGKHAQAPAFGGSPCFNHISGSLFGTKIISSSKRGADNAILWAINADLVSESSP